MAFIFTDDNFDQEALKEEKLVVVDFYADWCGPCKMMAPVIEELAEELKGEVKIGKLNVDDAPETARSFSVMNIPTILFLKNGSAVDKVVGAVPRASLLEKINQHK